MALLKEQERLCGELGDNAGLQLSLGNQAVILRDWGKLDEAMVLHKEEERLCRELGSIDGLCSSLGNQAVTLMRKPGGARRGLALADEAARLAAEHGLTALAQQIKPVLDYVRAEYQKTVASPPEASRDASTMEYFKYAEALAAWKSLPFLKRMRTKKPEPPRR